MTKEGKKIIVDVRGAMFIVQRKTGKRKAVSKVAEENGMSTTTFQNWDKEAPAVVKFIKRMLDENPCLTFDDLVKEV